jgi:prepilin signal peptidase PulO-like enzyme (type II secretory pathway)
MELVSILFIFILGLLIGSFVNVVSLRFNTGLSYVEGRSRCPNCNTKLSWFELFPLFSFIFLKGRCKTCHSPISYQYPITELISGIIFVCIVLKQYQAFKMLSFGFSGLIISSFFYFFVFSLLFVIALYDIKHMIVPDNLVYTFIGVSIVALFYYNFKTNSHLTTVNFLNLLSPIILSLPFAMLWYFSGGRWIGFGDVKLIFGIGALLGLAFGFSAVILGFWAGAIWSVYLLLKAKMSKSNQNTISMSSEVPFAPFLILGTFIAYAYSLDVLHLGVFISLLNH